MRVLVAVLLAGSLLAVVPGGASLGLGARGAGASEAVGGGGEALIHRTVIEEGRELNFEISNFPAHSAYYVFVKPVAAYTAEEGDFVVKTPDGQSGFVTIGVNSGEPVIVDSVSKRIRLEIAAVREAGGAADTDDETFGVMLCTTADCTGGTVLGDWEITIEDVPVSTAVSGGTGVTVSHTGDGTSMMEKTRNNDAEDHRDEVIIALSAVPTEDIVVLGKVDTQVSTGALTTAIAKPNGPPASGNTSANPGDWYFVTRFDTTVTEVDGQGQTTTRAATVADLEARVSLVATNNAVDTAGGELSGTLEFKVVSAADADDTVVTNYANNDDYTAIELPDVPITVTDDDDPTKILLGHASPQDKIATENDSSDTAKFRVTLGRALVSGEEVTVPLVIAQGGTLGDHFSLSLDGSPQGVSYADSSDGERGLVTFTGPSAAAATIVVTAATDDGDSKQNTLLFRTFKDHQRWRTNFIPTSGLDGGVCAGEICDGGHFNDRNYYITLREAGPGLVFSDAQGGLLEERGEHGFTTLNATIRLSTRPTANVTVTTTIESLSWLSFAEGTSLTFTPSNWNTHQAVVIQTENNSTDNPDGLVTVTHSFSSTDSTYSGLADVTHDIRFVDDDPTRVSLSGGGNRSHSPSRAMVEGRSSHSDTLTMTLGRPLAAGEYARIPLTLVGLDNGSQVDTPQGLRVGANVAWPPQFNDVTMTATGTGVSYEHVNRRSVPHYGYRYIEFSGAGAQTATITLTPREGFDDGENGDDVIRVGLTARLKQTESTAGFVLPPHSNLGGGVSAGSGGDRFFGIQDTKAGKNIVPADWPLIPSGLGPGDSFRLIYVTKGKTDAGINDRHYYDAFVRSEILGTDFCANWYDQHADPGGASGRVLTPGRAARECVERGAGTDGTLGTDDDVITDVDPVGAGLGPAGVEALKPYASSFRAIVSTHPTDASGQLVFTEPSEFVFLFPDATARTTMYWHRAEDHAMFKGVDNEDGRKWPVGPIYWVNGLKVADFDSTLSARDFKDGDWDDEENPRYADGTLAQYDSNNDGTLDTQGPDPAGYWTGSSLDGQGLQRGFQCFVGGDRTTGRGTIGSRYVRYGVLNGSLPDQNPLGPRKPANQGQNIANERQCFTKLATTELSLYALSGQFTVESGVSIADASAAEGSDVTFTVSLPANAASNVTVPYTLSDGRGVEGDPSYATATGSADGTSADFTNAAGSVTINAGSDSATFTVSTTQDSTYEGDHYFTVTLGTPTGTNPPALSSRDKTATGTITDAADLPTVAFSAATATVAEDVSGGTVDLTVNKTAGTTLAPFSVAWATADDSAASPGDYTAGTGTLVFAATDTSKTISIPIIDDSTSGEGAETFTVTLSDPVDAKLGTAKATTITINDDDGGGGDVLVSWSQSDGSALEPNTEIGEGDTFTVKVSLSAPAASDVTIPISFSIYGSGSGDAAANDFTVPTGVDIAKGQSSGTFDIEATLDSLLEAREIFRVDMCFSGCPAGYTVGQTAVGNDFVVVDGTVGVSWSQTDDSALPTGNDSPVVKEGDTYTIKVSLSSAPSSDVEIPIDIQGSGPTAVAADYTIPSSVTIPSGQTSATFDITATVDSLSEDREVFNLVLCPTGSCPAGYSFSGSPALLLVFVRDVTVVTDISGLADDTAVNKQLDEGESAEFTVKLEVDPTVDATLTIKVVDGFENNLRMFRDASAADHVTIDTDPDTDGFQNTLTFTGGGSGTWNTPQTVRVFALYDDDADTGSANDDQYTIGFLNSAASGPYMSQVNSTGELISLEVPDAGHGVAVSETSVEVEESGTVTYTIQPESDPGGTVTITPTAGVTTTATVSGAVSFDSSNWKMPKTVTVTGVAAGNTTVTHAVTTATTDYPMSTTVGSVAVTVTSGTAPRLEIGPGEVSSALLWKGGTVTLTLTPKNVTFLKSASGTGGGGGSGPVGGATAYTESGTDSLNQAGRNLITFSGATGLSVASATLGPKTRNVHGQTRHRTLSVVLSHTGSTPIISDATVTLTVGSALLRDLSSSTAAPVSSNLQSTFTVKAPTGVPVAITASDGDSDGNAVEGASDSTGYRTVTVSLFRELTGGESITVPLTVKGAEVTTDYTFALQPGTQSGVTLLTGGAYSMQNPAVRFGAGVSSATLRLTPVDNQKRSQPYVVIDYAGAPIGSTGVTVGETVGGPIGFALADDETGAIEVPADWALKPAGVGAGETFRLIFVTSQSRDATSADIDDYNNFVRRVAGANGHAGLLPYAGLVKVLGSTVEFGSTPAVDARENAGMWDPDADSGSGAYTDSSTSATSSGTAVYWLKAPPADKAADNYFDFFDLSWDGGNDQRQESADESGASRSGADDRLWSGTQNSGVGFANSALGGSPLVALGSTNAHQVPFDSTVNGPPTETFPFLAISPVFQAAAASAGPELSVALPQGEGESRNSDMELVVPELAGIKTFNLSLDAVPTADLVVCVRVAESGGADRVTAASEGVKKVTFASGIQSAMFDVSWTDTNVDDRDSTVTVTAVPSTETGCSGAGAYTVSATAASDTVRIEDDDETVVSLSSSDMSMTEGDATDTAVVTVSLGRRIYAGESVRALVALASGTGAGLPGDTTPDFGVAISGTGTTNTGTSRNALSILFTGHDSNTVQTATITLTPVAGRDDGDTSNEVITATLTVASGSGSGTDIGGGAAPQGDPERVTLGLVDDETPQSSVLSISELRVSEISGDVTYYVRLLTAPSGGDTTVTIAPQSWTTPDVALGSTTGDTGAVSLDKSSLTFTSSNYQETQAVTMSFIDEPGQHRNRSVRLVHTANGGGYSSAVVGDLDVVVADASEVEVFEVVRVHDRAAYERWYRSNSNFGIFRPNTITSTPGIGSSRFILSNRLQYVVRLSNRPTGTVTVDVNVTDVAGSGPADIGISLTRNGTPQESLAITFSDRDPDPGCGNWLALDVDEYRDTNGRVQSGVPEDYDSTADTSWQCWRMIWVQSTPLPQTQPHTVCADLVHTASGGGVRQVTVDTMRAFNLGTNLESDGCELLHTNTNSPGSQQSSQQSSQQGDGVGSSAPFELEAVSNLAVAVNADGTATATWDAVPGAAYYRVGYETRHPSDSQARTAGTKAGWAATSWTFDHGAKVPVEIVVTVTPAFTDDIGHTQYLDGLAATVTVAEPGYGPECPAAPDDAVTAQEVQGWRDAFPGDTARVKRWNRVLEALGEDTASGETAMTVAEAQANIAVWGARWDRVTRTLQAAACATPPDPEISITAGKDVAEGEDAVFTLAASPAPAADLDVTVAVAATGDHGVTTGTQTVTVPTTGTVKLTVATASDAFDEADGTVTATVSTASGYTVSSTDGTATVTVADDDVPEISIAADTATVTEGADAAFTVTADPAPHAAVDVTVAITAAGDYGVTTGTQTVTVPTTGTVKLTVATAGDALDEADGSVTAAASSGSGYTISSSQGTATVTVADDDPAVCVPQLPTDAVTAAEVTGWRDRFPGDTERVARWNQVLEALGTDTGSGQTAITAAEAQANEATFGARWDRVARTLQAHEACNDPDPAADDDSDADSDPDADADADDDPPPPPPPTVSITGGNGVTEGRAATFTVSASPQPSSPLSVDVSVAQSGSYGVATGTRTVTVPISGTATLAVATSGDSTDEPNGSVTVTVSSGTGYTVSQTDGAATVSVNDDDDPLPPPPTPTVSITAGNGVTEGSAATFTVTASPSPSSPLRVDVSVAQSGSYGVATGRRTVTVPISGSVTLSVATSGDSTDEPNGSVTVTVSSGTGYTVSQTDGSASVTVSDDDDPPPPPPDPTVSITGGNGVTEGSPATFTISASPRPSSPLSVDVSVAQSGSHGVATGTRTVTVPISGSVTLSVPTSGDSTDEPNGSVTVTVSSGTGYTVSQTDGSATVTVSDDDDPPPPSVTISIEDASGEEGLWVTFKVTLSEAADHQVKVRWDSDHAYDLDPYAIAGNEFWYMDGTLTFAPGQTEKSASVYLNDDSYAEADELFRVRLSSPQGATIADGEAIMTITDND